jgi:hypothetical protein
MDCLGVNPHLDPNPDCLESDPIAVDCPLDPPKQRSELSRDFMDRCFEATSSLFLGLVVLDGEVDQRHSAMISRRELRCATGLALLWHAQGRSEPLHRGLRHRRSPGCEDTA